MPFYEYECSNCKFYTEVMQKISDTPLTKCPSCGKSALVKLVSAPNFRLKGGGWYETDFKSDKENKRNLVAAEREEASSKPDESKPAKADEAKPAAASSEPAAAKSAGEGRSASTGRGASKAGSGSTGSGPKRPGGSRAAARKPKAAAKSASRKKKGRR